MGKFKLYIKLWGPVIVWCGLIFYLSSIPNLKSGAADVVDFILRKGAHVFEYTVLAALVYRAVNYGQSKINYWLPLVFAVLFAISDEYHQSLVPSRSPQVRDILIDGSGPLVLVAWLWYRHRSTGTKEAE